MTPTGPIPAHVNTVVNGTTRPTAANTEDQSSVITAEHMVIKAGTV